MSDKKVHNVDVRYKPRADTAANWELHNPILMKDEIGYVTDTNPRKHKFGDGITRWNALPFNVEGGEGGYPIVAVDFTILMTDWIAETYNGFSYHCDLTISGLKSYDLVRADFDFQSVLQAEAAEVASAGETFDGRVRFFSKTVPEADLTGKYTVYADRASVIDVDGTLHVRADQFNWEGENVSN